MKSVVISCSNANEELMSRAQKIFQYKSMKSVKVSRYIDERNDCVIGFYRFIDTIDITRQLRFTEFYRFIFLID